MRKLTLKLDELAVDSFATVEPKEGEGGTVEAFMRGCTGRNTCTCPTSIYQCGTVPATFSCITKIDC